MKKFTKKLLVRDAKRAERFWAEWIQNDITFPPVEFIEAVEHLMERVLGRDLITSEDD